MLLLVTAGLHVDAQHYSTRSKKAISYFEDARRDLDLNYYNGAREKLLLALKADDKFIEAYLLLGEVYYASRQPALQIEVYKKALAIDEDYSPRLWYFLAEAEYHEGLYNEALTHVEKYLALGDKSTKNTEAARYLAHRIRFAVKAISQPVPFVPLALEGINSDEDEYWPTLTVDESRLIFTRSKMKEGTNENFFVAEKSLTGWSEARMVPPPLNTTGNEAASSLAADGRSLFFMKCTCPNGGERCCDIYYSSETFGMWSKPRPLPTPVNSADWESQPSVSADGRWLFFVSTRPGGKGGMDIWVCEQLAPGIWSEAVNLGDSINTSGHEKAPFIHPDNQTLYFTSDYWPGMGRDDVFMSRLKSNGQWTIAKNLGYPVNTKDNEMGLIVNAKGDLAYFSSARNPLRGHDLYTFELAPEIRPVPVNYALGKIYDAVSGKPLRGRYELFDPATGSIVYSGLSDSLDGTFLLCLPKDKSEYGLNADKKGYLFYSRHLEMKGGTLDKPFLFEVPLQPVVQGSRMILRNVFFETAKYDLKSQSFTELDKLVTFLKQNPGIRARIEGHTDNVGTEAYNLQLSENRARSVYEYLVSKGISANRLEYKGYGFSQPIADNETEEGRSLNRRTECSIIENKK